jgi:hypothetical protein
VAAVAHWWRLVCCPAIHRVGGNRGGVDQVVCCVDQVCWAGEVDGRVVGGRAGWAGYGQGVGVGVPLKVGDVGPTDPLGRFVFSG